MLWNNHAFRSVETLIYDSIAAPTVTELSLKVMAGLVSSQRYGARVLDVGCGGGQLAVQMAKLRADLVINGLDLSPQQVERARKRAALSGLSAEYFQGSALNLPFKSATYDLVYSIASIKHWPDYTAGLRECLRVVKPGGLLVIVEVNKNCSKEIAADFISQWPLPFFLKPLALILFRVFVSNRSLTLDEAGKLVAALEVKKCDAEIYSEGLFWMFTAEK